MNERASTKKIELMTPIYCPRDEDVEVPSLISKDLRNNSVCIKHERKIEQHNSDEDSEDERYDRSRETLSIEINEQKVQNIDSLRLLAAQIRLLLTELELKTAGDPLEQYKEEKLKLREKVRDLEMVIRKHENYNLQTKSKSRATSFHRYGLLRTAPVSRDVS